MRAIQTILESGICDISKPIVIDLFVDLLELTK